MRIFIYLFIKIFHFPSPFPSHSLISHSFDFIYFTLIEVKPCRVHENNMSCKFNQHSSISILSINLNRITGCLYGGFLKSFSWIIFKYILMMVWEWYKLMDISILNNFCTFHGEICIIEYFGYFHAWKNPQTLAFEASFCFLRDLKSLFENHIISHLDH